MFVLENNTSRLPIIGGLLAAVGAALCCVGPFVLVTVGISGAWISNLTLIEPYRPFFIAAVLGMFAWSGWKIYQPVESFTPGTPCSSPEIRTRRKLIFWMALVIALILVISPYWIPLFVE